MEILAGILALLAVLFSGLSVAGIIRPSWFVNKRTGVMPTRAQIGGGNILIAIILVGIAAAVAPGRNVIAAEGSNSGGITNLSTDANAKSKASSQIENLSSHDLDSSAIEVPDCDETSRLISVETMSWDQTRAVCEAYSMKFAHNPQVRVLRRISKVSSLLSIDGLEDGDQTEVANSIMQIMQDRAQEQPDAQMRTAEIIWKMESGWHGTVKISAIHAFLKSYGDGASKLSDDGLVSMAAIIKESGS